MATTKYDAMVQFGIIYIFLIEIFFLLGRRIDDDTKEKGCRERLAK